MDFAPALAFYESALEKGSDAGMKVGWLSGESYQVANFAAICDVEGLDDGASVLDVGCGTGALLEYFERIGRRVEYVGVDISAKMIDAARARHPGAVFEQRDILASPPERRFDFVVCSGTLNFKIADHARWVGDMITKMYELTDRAAVINLLNAAYPSGLRIQLDDKNEFSRTLPEDAVRFARRFCPDVRVTNVWASTFELVLVRPRAGAVAALARSLGVGTEDTPALQIVVEYAWRRRLYAEMRDLLRTMEPTAPILEHLGRAHARLGETSDAIAVFERAAALAPTREDACAAIGRLHFDAQRDAEAQTWLREALARDPNAIDARYGLVVSLQRTKQPEAARSVALEAAPGPGRELLDARTSTDSASMIAAYQRVLALAPRFVEALCALANVHEQRGQWSEANALWMRALELVPDDLAIRERVLRSRR